MITLLYGPNHYTIQRRLSDLRQQFTQQHGSYGVEQYDGDSLEANRLAELLQSVSLFTPQRLVTIKDASSNKPLWEGLGEWAKRVAEADDLHLVLVGSAPDKRTNTFKNLQNHAISEEVKELQAPELIRWLQAETEEQGGELGRNEAAQLVERAGTNQERLSHELDKLLVHEHITLQLIGELVEPTPQATAFELLDAILGHKPDKTKVIIAELRTTEDPYKFFGLLASQVFSLVVVVAGKGKSSQTIAKDAGIHPFVVGKLSSIAHSFTWMVVQQLVEQPATLDEHMKTRSADPWLQLEAACMKIATR